MSDYSQLEMQSDYSVRQGHKDIKSPPMSKPTQVKSQLKSNSQSLRQSLFKVKIVLGLVKLLTVIVGGIYIVTGQQDVMTTGDLDTKNNHTHLTLNERLVPHSHNTSHQSIVSSQVNTSHIQLPYNDSLTQGLTGNRTSRVKRRLPLKVLLGLVKVTGAVAPIVQVIKDKTTTSEITIPDTPTKQWIEAYNDTHHFQTN